MTALPPVDPSSNTNDNTNNNCHSSQAERLRSLVVTTLTSCPLEIQVPLNRFCDWTCQRGGCVYLHSKWWGEVQVIACNIAAASQSTKPPK